MDFVINVITVDIFNNNNKLKTLLQLPPLNSVVIIKKLKRLIALIPTMTVKLQ